MDINMDIDKLQCYIQRIYDGHSFNIVEYNCLLNATTRHKEFAATVFLYDSMKNNKVIPNDITYNHINRLHSKTIPENRKIRLQWDGKTRLPSRRRIHKIMKGYNYTDKYNNAKVYNDRVLSHIHNHPECLNYGRIKLAKDISKKCHISFDDARLIITHLKRTKKIKLVSPETE